MSSHWWFVETLRRKLEHAVFEGGFQKKWTFSEHPLIFLGKNGCILALKSRFWRSFAQYNGSARSFFKLGVYDEIITIYKIMMGF